MAGEKVIKLVTEAPGKGRAHRAEPLAEPHARDLDSYPIWVSIRNPEHARGVFRHLHDELNRAGFRCDGDLQTDPHDGLNIEAFFEIFLQVDQKRAPENLGIVTLFSDAQGKLVIKMNPCFPEACDDFRKALAGAIERQLGTATDAATLDVEIVIRQQNGYEPAKALAGAGEGAKSA
jgi:hypothetical protein